MSILGELKREYLSPDIWNKKKYSVSLLYLLHGLKPAKLFHLISENSHMAIYFIYFIFNKMVQWALATRRHRFQSVFRQRRQSILALLCCGLQLERWTKAQRWWKSEPVLIKPQRRVSKLSPGSHWRCLHNTSCQVQHRKSSLIRLTAKKEASDSNLILHDTYSQSPLFSGRR